MTMLPPNLLYLTIYNPTLSLPAVVAAATAVADEDASERAHILFYTSRDRAVSRDKMLRQVGLAKAMVNFSAMFNGGQPFDNVHSQTKRLVSVSPEPDFWIHAGIELARIPRAQKEKPKGKAKERADGNENVTAARKGKAVKSAMDPGIDGDVAYDHIEGSVQDLAMKADLFRGYEKFKLLHGTFTSILSTLGQEALELQLDRFFTVWAWTWALEDDLDFGTNLGVPLHAMFRSITPTLDAWSSRPSHELEALVLVPPHVIPSTKYIQSHYPASLPRHLISLVPLHATTPSLSTPKAANKPIPSFEPPPGTNGRAPRSASRPSSPERSGTKRSPWAGFSSGGNFLGIGTMNSAVGADGNNTRKWNWPGYTTFGKSTAMKPSDPTTEKVKEPDGPTPPEANGAGDHVDATQIDGSAKAVVDGPRRDLSAIFDVDTNSLTDAIASDDIRTLSLPVPPSDGDHDPPLDDSDIPREGCEPEEVILSGNDPAIQGIELPDSSSSVVMLDRSQEGSSASTLPSPPLLSTLVYLPDGEDWSNLVRRRILYVTVKELTLALVGIDSWDDDLGERAVDLLNEIHGKIEANSKAEAIDARPISVTKILQAEDKYIISQGVFTISNPDFASASEQFYNARSIQEREPDILEVFSRGQSPQHWHVARRGLGQDKDGVPIEGDVFMEDSRKEASLTDVDNVLAGFVRKYPHYAE